ncbi:MAG: Ig-like domain-containing protein [Kofleriaceae bacterium]|nr:Ig-like domain-containing protein [Kofleriaceae bacterium]
MTQRALWMAAAIAAVVLGGCGGKKQQGSSEPPPSTKKANDPAAVPDGLAMRLSNGNAGAPPYDRATLAAATKLGDAKVAALLARTKPLPADPADRAAFAIRPGSQPPPRAGQTIATEFPPPNSSRLTPPKPADTSKDVRVVRWMPEGKVPLAPELSVTFSQPMVAVTSQEDAAKVQPVTLTPTPKGRWRWIGTRTIVFDPDVRFPQATTYKVEVAAGTKSATGLPLAEGKSFTFETPPPTVVSSWPTSGPQRRDVPMFILFDQKIDAQKVLAKLQVSSKQPLKMLTTAEVEADKTLAPMVKGAKDLEGRWLAFRTSSPLPADTSVTVTIPAGTPSAEGPNTTTEAQTFSFNTFPPLKLEEAECGYNKDCRPRNPFAFRFNNPLDAEKLDRTWIEITPAEPNAKIYAQGTMLFVQGTWKPRTKYTVKIATGLLDMFGQTLDKGITETFDVGDHEPMFFASTGLVVADPATATPSYDVFTTSYPELAVKLYKVTPNDYPKYVDYLQNQWNKTNPPTLPGTLAFDKTIKTAPATSQVAETKIDLGPALANGKGHVIVVVEPLPLPDPDSRQRRIAWVQATKLAIDAAADGDIVQVFATGLTDAKPLANITVELRPAGTTATTDAQGIATMQAPAPSSDRRQFLVARLGDDVAMLPASEYMYGGDAWSKRTPPVQLQWYVTDDRALYRPGEEVSLKGWLRRIDYGKNGDVTGLQGVVERIDYIVNDAQGVQIAKGTTTVNAFGGFDTKLTLPKTPNLGHAYMVLTAVGPLGARTHHHSFRIEEFRRPEFEVTSSAGAGPFIVGGGGDVTVNAKYFTGAPLPGAEVQWYVTASETTFTPPNRDDYVFGTWRPWWGGYSMYDEGEFGGRHMGPGAGQSSWNHTAKTDAVGEHVLHMDYLSVKPSVPMSVTASATVMDVNRQAWSTSTALVVHPAALYVGIKTKKPFVEKGQPFDIDLVAVDIDGKLATNAKMSVDAVRLDWDYEGGVYKQKEVDPQHCDATMATDKASCSFQTKVGGSYQVTATIVDDKGRTNQSQITFWVAGGEGPPSRDVKLEQVSLIPDKKEYKPGDTAELLVMAPFHPAEGVVMWQRSGIVKTERITLDAPTKVIHVPIADAMTPNLNVQVNLAGTAERAGNDGTPDPKLPRRPAFAAGQINLPIPPKHRALTVEVKPAADKLAPAESTTLAVTVRDAQGKPVADAEVAVIVVDEAILSLTGHQFADPLGMFYPQRGSDTHNRYLRQHVKLAKLPATQTAGAPPPPSPAPGSGPEDAEGDGFGGAGTAMALEEGKLGRAENAVVSRRRAEKPAEPTIARDGFAENKPDAPDQAGAPGAPVAVRSNFNPLAAFSPSVTTDANGAATVPVTVPDNLTRYRVVALAVAGDKQFGKGESAVTARLPLMVRPSAPRFLNFGDTFQLPVVVQNQTDAPMQVELAVATVNLALTDGAGRAFTVPANDRALVQLPAAADMAGTARFQIVAAAGKHSDAAQVELPVWTPATTEAFATYGVIDNGSASPGSAGGRGDVTTERRSIAQPVALPGQVVTQFGGLEVTTASTNLQALTDAMIYLVHYPFECAEQRASRIMGIAALRDVLEAFEVKELPSRAEMEASVAVDVKRLTEMQNSDGGFAFWERGDDSVPYLTAYVVSALAKAKAKGFAIPANLLEQAKPYLRDIESHMPDRFYSPDTKRAIGAYALYVRKQIDDLDIAKGQRILREAGGPEKVTMETNGWLLATFAGNAAAKSERDAILRHALNKVSETAGAANFTTSYGDGAYLLLASDHRVDAVMLDALIQEQPASDLIPKVVTGLLAGRKGGRWLNTQENTFALLALDRYFQTYEKTAPNFVARVWLGNDYAGDFAFRGRTTNHFQINVPMKDVAAHDKQSLTIAKDGAGRLYYRIGMRYAPASLKLDAADYGFVVERTYEGIDNPNDVTRDAQGVWHVKAGARVRIKLAMVNENRRYHVALVDPLPAGLEPLNPSLATTAPIPPSGTTDDEPQGRGGRGYWWWYGPWYEHQNMRDERVEAFSTEVYEGVHKYEYAARATTPGNFVIPPAKAEEMYMPETFGRSASDRMIVE